MINRYNPKLIIRDNAIRMYVELDNVLPLLERHGVESRELKRIDEVIQSAKSLYRYDKKLFNTLNFLQQIKAFINSQLKTDTLEFL